MVWERALEGVCTKLGILRAYERHVWLEDESRRTHVAPSSSSGSASLDSMDRVAGRMAARKYAMAILGGLLPLVPESFSDAITSAFIPMLCSSMELCDRMDAAVRRSRFVAHPKGGDRSTPKSAASKGTTVQEEGDPGLWPDMSADPERSELRTTTAWVDFLVASITYILVHWNDPLHGVLGDSSCQDTRVHSPYYSLQFDRVMGNCGTLLSFVHDVQSRVVLSLPADLIWTFRETLLLGPMRSGGSSSKTRDDAKAKTAAAPDAKEAKPGGGGGGGAKRSRLSGGGGASGGCARIQSTPGGVHSSRFSRQDAVFRIVKNGWPQKIQPMVVLKLIYRMLRVSSSFNPHREKTHVVAGPSASATDAPAEPLWSAYRWSSALLESVVTRSAAWGAPIHSTFAEFVHASAGQGIPLRDRTPRASERHRMVEASHLLTLWWVATVLGLWPDDEPLLHWPTRIQLMRILVETDFCPAASSEMDWGAVLVSGIDASRTRQTSRTSRGRKGARAGHTPTASARRHADAQLRGRDEGELKFQPVADPDDSNGAFSGSGWAGMSSGSGTGRGKGDDVVTLAMAPTIATHAPGGLGLGFLADEGESDYCRPRGDGRAQATWADLTSQSAVDTRSAKRGESSCLPSDVPYCGVLTAVLSMQAVVCHSVRQMGAFRASLVSSSKWTLFEQWSSWVRQLWRHELRTKLPLATGIPPRGLPVMDRIATSDCQALIVDLVNMAPRDADHTRWPVYIGRLLHANNVEPEPISLHSELEFIELVETLPEITRTVWYGLTRVEDFRASCDLPQSMVDTLERVSALDFDDSSIESGGGTEDVKYRTYTADDSGRSVSSRGSARRSSVSSYAKTTQRRRVGRVSSSNGTLDASGSRAPSVTVGSLMVCVAVATAEIMRVGMEMHGVSKRASNIVFRRIKDIYLSTRTGPRVQAPNLVRDLLECDPRSASVLATLYDIFVRVVSFQTSVLDPFTTKLQTDARWRRTGCGSRGRDDWLLVCAGKCGVRHTIMSVFPNRGGRSQGITGAETGFKNVAIDTLSMGSGCGLSLVCRSKRDCRSRPATRSAVAAKDPTRATRRRHSDGEADDDEKEDVEDEEAEEEEEEEEDDEDVDGDGGQSDWAAITDVASEAWLTDMSAMTEGDLAAEMMSTMASTPVRPDKVATVRDKPGADVPPEPPAPSVPTIGPPIPLIPVPLTGRVVFYNGHSYTICPLCGVVAQMNWEICEYVMGVFACARCTAIIRTPAPVTWKAKPRTPSTPAAAREDAPMDVVCSLVSSDVMRAAAIRKKRSSGTRRPAAARRPRTGGQKRSRSVTVKTPGRDKSQCDMVDDHSSSSDREDED